MGIALNMEKIITKTVNKTKYFCDICGKTGYVRCEDCKRDICKDCMIEIEPVDGDSLNFYCKECFAIRQPFQKQIDKLEEEQDEIYNKMQKALEDKRNKVKLNVFA